MKKSMKVFLGVLLAVWCVVAVSAFAVSTVSSHAVPGLVDEINTALANPSVTTITSSGNATVGGDLTVTGGDITGANTNKIDIGEVASGTITFSRSTSGTMTLTSADDDANAALTVSAGGTGALTLGDSGSTTAITSSDWAIDATGVATGLGNVTSDGTVQGAGLKSASAGITIISGAYTGVLNIVSTTLTLVVNGTVTNVLDADITTP